MKIKKSHIAPFHKKIRLKDFSTSDKIPDKEKKRADETLAKHREQLNSLQELMTADARHAILVVLQGMDTAGKDGTIRHIFTGVNPQACSVTPFKVPTPLERQHDYLWRAHRAVPARGTIGIFNRSHYEDVLVTRVHKMITDKLALQRMEQIVEFEKMLSENGVAILKFFLHISRDEQTRRLESRLADASKHWKISEADFAERHLWADYTRAYEDAISHTSRKFAPWFIIPSDDKLYRNLVISQMLVDTLKGIKMKYPQPTFDPEKIKL